MTGECHTAGRRAMALIECLDRWTDLVREFIGGWDHVASDISYAPITQFRRVVLTGDALGDEVDELLDDSKQTRTELRRYLAAGPDDIAVRWTVLAILYELGRERELDDDEVDGDPYEDLRVLFRDELTELVALPQIATLTEPKRVRWEIINSCLVSEFGRAEALFDRAADLVPTDVPEICAVRGQFHLLKAMATDAIEMAHATVRLAPADSPRAARLGRWGVMTDETSPVDRSRLNEARDWFEKAIQRGFALPPEHRASLGRCHFIAENYRQAAATFQGIVEAGGIVLRDRQAVINDELNAAVHLAAARAHQRAGDLAAAANCLEKCVSAFPTYGAAYRRLAELRIDTDADYRGAYEVLVRWADAEPELASDIWVRTLRGVGGIEDKRSVQEMLDEFFDAHPQRLDWVRSAVGSHWCVFGGLSESAQKQWLYGCWILWWRPPGFEAIDYAAATGYFCRALELELRQQVFTRFVEGLGNSIADLKADLDEHGLNARGKTAWRELLEGKGSLGQMLRELDPDRSSELRVSKRFREWVKAPFRRLIDGYAAAEARRITDPLRNVAEHKGELDSRGLAEEACGLCVKYLDYIVRPD
jgi:tetratricopeptide (TPR) repeat protein